VYLRLILDPEHQALDRGRSFIRSIQFLCLFAQAAAHLYDPSYFSSAPGWMRSNTGTWSEFVQGMPVI